MIPKIGSKKVIFVKKEKEKTQYEFRINFNEKKKGKIYYNGIKD